MKSTITQSVETIKRDPVHTISLLLKDFDKGQVVLTAQTPTKKRTTAQNRSMFGIPYKMISERLTELWGEDVSVDMVHDIGRITMDLTSYDVQLLREEIKMLAAIMRAKARIDGMNAENEQRKHRGESLAYIEKNFTDVIAEEDIDQSSVIENLYHRV